MSTKFATGRLSRLRGDAGMAVAEYAVATVAVVALAMVLHKLLTSATVFGLLMKVIEKAFEIVF